MLEQLSHLEAAGVQLRGVKVESRAPLQVKLQFNALTYLANMPHYKIAIHNPQCILTTFGTWTLKRILARIHDSDPFAV